MRTPIRRAAEFGSRDPIIPGQRWTIILLTHTGVHNVAWMKWGEGEYIGQGTAFLERVLVPDAECGMSAKHREGRGNDAMQHQPPIPAGPL